MRWNPCPTLLNDEKAKDVKESLLNEHSKKMIPMTLCCTPRSAPHSTLIRETSFIQYIVMNTETHNWITRAVRDSKAFSPCLCERRGNLILNSSYTDYDFCNTICKEAQSTCPQSLRSGLMQVLCFSPCKSY